MPNDFDALNDRLDKLAAEHKATQALLAIALAMIAGEPRAQGAALLEGVSRIFDGIEPSPSDRNLDAQFLRWEDDFIQSGALTLAMARDVFSARAAD